MNFSKVNRCIEYLKIIIGFEDKEEYDKFIKDVERLNSEPGTAGGKGSQ